MPTMPSPRDEAYLRFLEAKDLLLREIDVAVRQIGEVGNVRITGFASATVDLMMSGLNEWLAAAAQDRASAEASRKVQDSATSATIRLSRTMVFLTLVIALATVWGALKPSPQIVVQAPIIPPAAVYLPSTPVTLNPVINVTAPTSTPATRRSR